MSSGFNESPFGQPNIDNPFSDVSVSAAVAPSNMNPTQGLDEYNPFDGKGTGPAVMKPSVEEPGRTDPPFYRDSGPQQISTADFQRRQEELEKRAKELERREEQLRNLSVNARVNNWPPVPSFCPLKPCFYQDINVDIPVEFQKIVRYLYYLWMMHVSLLLANLLIGLLYLFVGGDAGITFGLALVFFFIFTPASFLCWFRPAYKAFRDDSSFSFIVFFFVFFFQTLISVVNFLGIGDMGSCGLIMAIGMLKSSIGSQIFVGILMLLSSLGFAVAGLCDAYLLIRIHRLYRSSGASLAKAQSEFTHNVMSNETVQQAAASTVRHAAQNNFGNTNNSNAPPRY